MKASLKKLDRFAWIILALALILRIVVAQMVLADGVHWGDSLYYRTVASEPIRFLYDEYAPVTSIAPLYPILLIPFYQLIPESLPLVQLQAVQVAQALTDTVTIILLYLLVLRLFDDQRVARAALVIQAFDIRYAFQASKLVTEVVYICLIVGFMLVYLNATSEGKMKRYREAGLLLGLAVLTRPVPLLFPAVLVVHAWLNPQDRRQALKGVAQLTGIMLLVVLPWVARSSFASGDFVPLSDTVFSQLFMSSRSDQGEDDGLIEEVVREEIGSDSFNDTSNQQYLQAALGNILSAPWQWGKRIMIDTLRAYSQPYPTLLLIAPAEKGAREIFRDFFAGQASLVDVLTIPGLWRRLLMYIWHFGGMIGGFVGLVLAWREYKKEMVLLFGWVIYITATTAALLIEPRYVFPAMFVFTILTAYAAIRLYDMIQSSRHKEPETA